MAVKMRYVVEVPIEQAKIFEAMLRDQLSRVIKRNLMGEQDVLDEPLNRSKLAKKAGVSVKTIVTLLSAGVSEDDLEELLEIRDALTIYREADGGQVKEMCKPTIDALIKAYEIVDCDIEELQDAVEEALEILSNMISERKYVEERHLNAALLEGAELAHQGDRSGVEYENFD